LGGWRRRGEDRDVRRGGIGREESYMAGRGVSSISWKGYLSGTGRKGKWQRIGVGDSERGLKNSNRPGESNQEEINSGGRGDKKGKKKGGGENCSGDWSRGEGV